MKKVYIPRSQVEPTETPRRIAVLESFDVGLIVRYFDVLESCPSDSQLLGAIPPIASSVDGCLVVGGAVPEIPYLAGRFIREAERQTLNPGALATNDMFGIAELYDFVAIVYPLSFSGSAEAPFSYFVDGAQAKAGLRRVGRNREAMMFLTFTATHSEDSIDNWTIIRVEHPVVAFVDRTPGDWTTAPADFKVLSTLPTIEIVAPATVLAGGQATVEIRVVNQDGTPYPYNGDLVVEALSGYVSKSRVSISEGVGFTRILPLGLEAGDTIRIKAGTRLITGLAEASIAVVNA